MITEDQHLILKKQYQDLTELSKEAVARIKWLEEQNQLLSAKIEGVELMALAITSNPKTFSSLPQTECIIHKINCFLNKNNTKKYSSPELDEEELKLAKQLLKEEESDE